MDINALSAKTMQQLLEAGLSGEKISRMSWVQAFDAWCQYEGLINYGPTLRNLIKELEAADRTPHIIVLIGEDSIEVRSDNPDVAVDVIDHKDFKKYYDAITEPGRKYFTIE